MNGAQALLRTLLAAGVDTCFMNPGTSEMHFVAALDQVPETRGVLALFEGVATGAADGYARMTGQPAATLLHLGPGLGNGIANLHNARRAASPVVNIVGDHATYHQRLDAPLQSDIHSLASNVSGWVRSSTSVEAVGPDAAAAIAAARRPPGQVATLIVAADLSWTEGAVAASAPAPEARRRVDGAVVEAVAEVLRRGEPAALLVGGSANRAEALRSAAAVAAATGAKVLGETFPARLERGGGRHEPERLAYLGELAQMQMQGLAHLILVDAASPVSFFAYPDLPGDLVPDGCQVHTLAAPGDDAGGALAALAGLLGGPSGHPPFSPPPPRPALPSGGAITGESLGQVVGALLPDDCIVVDEAITSGLWVAGATAGAGPHDWLTLTGGAIGIGLPLSLGAAIGAPGRRVLALQADGSALYTYQALWSMAREGVDVTTLVLSNRSYAILNMELKRVGAAGGGERARRMLDLRDPDIDFASLARGLGVPATQATTAAELADQLAAALATPGPTVVEAVIERS